jgi:tetratricopeptide (TPR) repeat protein
MDSIDLRRTALAFLSAGLMAPSVSAGQPVQRPAAPAMNAAAESSALRRQGLELGYNLDHEEALEAFRAAMAADPADPAPHRMMAATMWIQLLFQRGAVTADDYLGQARADLGRTPPSPEVSATFQAHIDRALELCELRLRNNPADADAHYQIGAAHGFLTSYKATVEGRVLGGFRTARRAYTEHERVMELDPRRKDAGLIVGMYRYGVSTLSGPLRLLAGIAGFGGGRERGLRLVEEAAAHASDNQTNAMFTLIVIYNREARYDDALRVIGELQRRYPRNRLLWLEAASTALRASRPADARRAIEDGRAKFAQDRRPRAFGEAARWHYYLGAALVGLRQADAAGAALRAVLSTEGPEWLRGRAHKELGKLGDLAGDRARAVAEYRLASSLCRTHHDSACSEETQALMKARYR